MDLNEIVPKLVKSAPMKSYFRLTFRKTMQFMLLEAPPQVQPTNQLIDTNELISLINDLKEAFQTLCFEDHLSVKIPNKLMTKTHNDESFILAWAIVEAAKYCIAERLSPESLTLNKFLTLLERQLVASIGQLSNKASAILLLTFIETLDKLLQDQISEVSTCKHTFQPPKAIKDFYSSHAKQLYSWFIKSSHNVSRLALWLDDPAECWRCISWRQRYDIESSLALMSISNHIRSPNLMLICQASKRLGDIHMINGVQKIMAQHGYKDPTLDAIANNLEGRFDKTTCDFTPHKELDQHLLIEYLDANVSLGQADKNLSAISSLSSRNLREIYAIYSSSTQLENPSSSDIVESKIDEIKSWMSCWSPAEDVKLVHSGQTLLDLIIPASLNIISKLPFNENHGLLDWLESLIKQDSIAQSLSPPYNYNRNYLIYKPVIELLKADVPRLPQKLVDYNIKDLQYCYKLYRRLQDTGLVQRLRVSDLENMNLVQLSAAKYLIRNDNKLGIPIANELVESVGSDDRMKVLASLLINKDTCDIGQSIESSTNLEDDFKRELKLKLLRKRLRESDELSPETDKIAFEYQSIIDCQVPLESKAKTLLYISRNLNAQCEKEQDLLNETFELDVRLLESLCYSSIAKHSSRALECGSRILQRIVASGQVVSKEIKSTFRSSVFMNLTLKVWISLKSNLLSITFEQDSLDREWRDILFILLKHICNVQPGLLLYCILMNQFELRKSDSGALLNDDVSSSESRPKPWKLRRWDELLDESKSSQNSGIKWSEVVSDTELFLKEIRRISFLPGEYLRMLTERITKKLRNFLDTIANQTTAANNVDDSYRRLAAACDYGLNGINSLLDFLSNKDSNLTLYDKWFSSSFKKELRELGYRLGLLARKQHPFIQEDLEKLVKSVTELLAQCRLRLLEYNSGNEHKLYMEMISPILSRQVPSNILMPYCAAQKQLVKVYKISQTVNLIASKTNPKKFNLLGTDGIMRTFLLKAHDDSRLDQLLMEVFRLLNEHFKYSRKNQNCQIKCYSVTPVSSRSGLIEWIDAKSLFSIYKAWLDGPKGRELQGQLYASTCKQLCGEQTRHDTAPSSSLSHNCQMARSPQAADVFYQLLWAKARELSHPMANSKPTVASCLKLRTQLSPRIFQLIVEQLESKMPDQLISNELWYSSSNSHSYWLKTKNFVDSLATISFVGYIIGLGDRHSDNILLNCATGQLINIDFNISFELGKSLAVPEKVPFRLTQNLVHALGFAGIEGGFSNSCRHVLGSMRDFKATLLHLLHPVNLHFMINRGGGISSSNNINIANHLNQRNSHQSPLDINAATSTTFKNNLEMIMPKVPPIEPATKRQVTLESMQMLSQESFELDEVVDEKNPASEIDALLIADQKLIPKLPPVVDPRPAEPIAIQARSSCDLQQNIKTPAKLQSHKVATIHARISDKLSGCDELILNSKLKRESKQEQIRRLLEQVDSEETEPRLVTDDPSMEATLIDKADFIKLDKCQPVDEQVDALIREARSIANKSSMFEGWIPWF